MLTRRRGGAKPPPTRPSLVAAEAESRTRGKFESNPVLACPWANTGGVGGPHLSRGVPSAPRPPLPCHSSSPASPRPHGNKTTSFRRRPKRCSGPWGCSLGVKPAGCRVLRGGCLWVSASTSGGYPTHRSCHCRQKRGYLKDTCPVSLAASPRSGRDASRSAGASG